MNAGVQPTLLRRCLYSLVPVLLVLTTGELATRLLGTPPCEPVAPSATGWFSMRADPDLLWSLEPGLDFDMPDGVTRIKRRVTTSAGARRRGRDDASPRRQWRPAQSRGCRQSRCARGLSCRSVSSTPRRHKCQLSVLRR